MDAEEKLLRDLCREPAEGEDDSEDKQLAAQAAGRLAWDLPKTSDQGKGQDGRGGERKGLFACQSACLLCLPPPHSLLSRLASVLAWLFPFPSRSHLFSRRPWSEQGGRSS